MIPHGFAGVKMAHACLIKAILRPAGHPNAYIMAMTLMKQP